VYVCVRDHARACVHACERERERESKECSLLYVYKVCVCHGKNVTSSFVKKIHSVNGAM